MKKGLACLLFLSSLFSPISAEFVQRKNGVSLHVYDFSVRPDSKLIGSEIGAREIKELNRHNIYPILIDIRNYAEGDFLLSPGAFSIPQHSLGYMKLFTPKSTNMSVLAALGMLTTYLSMLGAGGFTVASVCDSSSKSWFTEIQRNKFVQGGGAWLLASIYGFISFLSGEIERTNTREKDQGAWLNEWMLSSAVVIPTQKKLKKFIFLDKANYQKGGFVLELLTSTVKNKNLVFDVSLLP